MNIAFAKAGRSLKQINIESGHAVLALIVLLLMLGYRGFMAMQSNRLAATIVEKNQELMDTKKKLTDIQKNRGYLKLLAAKHLESEVKTINWEQSLKYLTNLLEQLKSFNKTQAGVELTNFQIDSSKISFQGNVSALKDIYSEGGIIDAFSSYPFVKHFNVPSYTQNLEKGGYNFYLDADIKHYDGSEPTS